ncbi:MAG: ComF family protein [Alphaproteobacteria bacterium]|nr:ComF family protein [Alphaproteobacteria bacterium]
MRLLSSVLNAFLPPRCIKCGKILAGTEDGLCPECFNEINFISRPYCEKCGRPLDEKPSGSMVYCASCLQELKPHFRYSRSAFRYDDKSKNMILSFKFLDKTENAKVLGDWMYNAGKDIWNSGAEVLVPVPLHYTRLLKRRYNQSALLCNQLSKRSGLPVEYTAIQRHIKTRPQVEFSGAARIKNVRNAFQIKSPEKIRGKHVVLVDDVMTTGSTLKECALALHKAGAASVDALTIARVC